MLTLDDLLDSTEPHATFERATVRAMTIDYERGRFVADIDLRVGDPGAGDEDARERLRRGRLTVEGLRMWALEPPERTHRQRRGLVLGKHGLLERAPTDAGPLLSVTIGAVAASWFFHFIDIDAYGYLAGERASFVWSEGGL